MCESLGAGSMHETTAASATAAREAGGARTQALASALGVGLRPGLSPCLKRHESPNLHVPCAKNLQGTSLVSLFGDGEREPPLPPPFLEGRPRAPGGDLARVFAI